MTVYYVSVSSTQGGKLTKKGTKSRGEVGYISALGHNAPASTSEVNAVPTISYLPPLYVNPLTFPLVLIVMTLAPKLSRMKRIHVSRLCFALSECPKKRADQAAESWHCRCGDGSCSRLKQTVPSSLKRNNLWLRCNAEAPYIDLLCF